MQCCLFGKFNSILVGMSPFCVLCFMGNIGLVIFIAYVSECDCASSVNVHEGVWMCVRGQVRRKECEWVGDVVWAAPMNHCPSCEFQQRNSSGLLS